MITRRATERWSLPRIGFEVLPSISDSWKAYRNLPQSPLNGEPAGVTLECEKSQPSHALGAIFPCVMSKANSDHIDGYQPDRAASLAAMKARQCSKLGELRQVLVQAGYLSLNQQSIALGLSRSTTWVILRANHKNSGLSGSVIKRMLRSRQFPPEARQWLEEYVAERLAGAYGHNKIRLDLFRAQVELAAQG